MVLEFVAPVLPELNGASSWLPTVGSRPLGFRALKLISGMAMTTSLTSSVVKKAPSNPSLSQFLAETQPTDKRIAEHIVLVNAALASMFRRKKPPKLFRCFGRAVTALHG